MPPPTPDAWYDLVHAARSYALRKYGFLPSGITLHGPAGILPHREPFPPGDVPGDSQLLPSATSPKARASHEWASGPEPRHLSDFRAVFWPGLGKFILSELQAGVVRQLWAAMEEGTYEIQQMVLLRNCSSDSSRLVDLFKSSGAWGTLVIKGSVPGAYRLPPLPDPEAEASA